MGPPKGAGAGPRSMMGGRGGQSAALYPNVNPSDIANSFRNILGQYQQVEQNQKVSNDTSSKLDIMFDRLNNNQFTAMTLTNLNALSQNINDGNQQGS